MPTLKAILLKDIHVAVGGTLRGDPELSITGVGSLDHAGPNDIAPLDSDSFVERVADSSAGAIIAATRLTDGAGANCILHDHPLVAMNEIIGMLQLGSTRPAPGIHETAVVDSTATVAASAAIAPLAVVGAHAVIGERAVISSHVVIERGVIVGDDSTIEPGAVLHEGAVIGQRSTIGANSVISRQGFGFTTGPRGPVHLNHVGKTIIGDDTHIGAVCTIDRARFDVTRIGNMTALDNHFHAGHNSVMGDRCFFAASCGLAGHAIVEDDVVAGGHVGISNVTVGARSQIGAKTSVMKGFGPDTKILGVPARLMSETMRMESTLRKLALTKEQRKGRRAQ